MDRYPVLLASRLLVLLLMAGLAGCASNAPAPEETAPVYRPEQSKQWAQEGRQALEAGHREVALTAWQKSLAANPANATVRNNLALLLKEQKRFDEAARLLQAGLAVTPEVPDLHYNLAVISELYLLDLDTALEHYRQYQALADDDSQNVAGWIADLERRLQ
ncbi:tetratricopeptide repeat protein [Marinobacter sp. VGCF2001]|uniref:tetratricopeptide repeat protein n=1 Tax=Marinobacter sp. VGCF2001 TaxID=3417189 RepID=UPI003CF2A018